MPRWLRYSTLIAISFASIAMLGLAISLFNPKLFDRYFPFLLVLNAVIAAVLFCVVTTLCLRLARRQRSKQYGSHMTAKLALTTALISVVPTQTAAQMLHSIPDTDAQIYSYCSASGCTCGYASIPGYAAHILPQALSFLPLRFPPPFVPPHFRNSTGENPPERKPFPTVPSGFSPHTPAPVPNDETCTESDPVLP